MPDESIAKAAYETFQQECSGYTLEWTELSKHVKVTWGRVAQAVLVAKRKVDESKGALFVD